MAERLMYAPSLGFAIAVGAVMTRFLPGEQEEHFSMQSFFGANKKLMGILGVIFVLFFFKTYSRNKDWHDNLTLHSQDVLSSPNSARSHYYLGNHIVQDDFIGQYKDPKEKMQRLRESISELQKSVAIYPDFADAYSALGKAYMLIPQNDTSAYYYKKAVDLNPTNPMYRNNYGTVLYNTGKYEEAIREFEEAVKRNRDYAHAYFNLGSVYGNSGEGWAKQNNPQESKKCFLTAIENFQKALKCDPGYASAVNFLAITYKNLGDKANQAKYENMLKQMNPRK
jgi:tetratricopeptide (TPR) repeat protein